MTPKTFDRYIIVVLLLCAVCILFYPYKQVYYAQNEGYSPTGEIIQGIEIMQILPIDQKNILAVELRFATYLRKNKGDLVYKILTEDKKTVVDSGIIHPESLMDNSFYTIPINSDISQYKTLILKIEAPDTLSGKGVTLWGDASYSKDKNLLYINGEMSGALRYRLKEKAELPTLLKNIIYIYIFLSGIAFWLAAKSRKVTKVLFVGFVFFLYFFWAAMQNFDYAPDEKMRSLLPLYIYQNGMLPLGTTPETGAGISGDGISYAYYLTWIGPIASAIFMKIYNFFSGSIEHLLLAARLMSIFCGTLTTILVMKMAVKLFDDYGVQWLFIVCCSFMPQFVFLSSYINNDIIAVCASAMIFLSWILAQDAGWNYKNSTMLAMGISGALLSYYNSYMWVLSSALLFLLPILFRKRFEDFTDYNNLKKYGIYVLILVTICSGGFFLRNIILYQGDVFGLKSFNINHPILLHAEGKFSAKDLNQSVWTVFQQKPWIYLTAISFVGLFGRLDVLMPNQGLYYFYFVFFIIGICFYIIKPLKDCKLNKLIISLLVLCMVIPFLLSVYYSYSIDWQAQGRYLYPGFLPFIYFVISGWQKGLRSIFKENKLLPIVYMMLIGIFIAITVFIGSDMIAGSSYIKI